MKRTTLILEDACMNAVRRLAHEQNRPISEVVNALLVEGLARRKVKQRRTFELPTFAMGRPRVNLADRNALESVMDS